MKCPECGNETKIIQKNSISLCLQGTGYYCEECMKVFAVFEQR